MNKPNVAYYSVFLLPPNLERDFNELRRTLKPTVFTVLPPCIPLLRLEEPLPFPSIRKIARKYSMRIDQKNAPSTYVWHKQQLYLECQWNAALGKQLLSELALPHSKQEEPLLPASEHCAIFMGASRAVDPPQLPAPERIMNTAALRLAIITIHSYTEPWWQELQWFISGEHRLAPDREKNK